MFRITAFVTSVITPKNLPGIKYFLAYQTLFSCMSTCCGLASFEYPMLLDLDFVNCFLLWLIWWNLCSFGVSTSSPGWLVGHLTICLMSLAVDLEDSNFLASCLSLLAENFSRLMLESLIVLETNSSSLRKKPKYVSM